MQKKSIRKARRLQCYVSQTSGYGKGNGGSGSSTAVTMVVWKGATYQERASEDIGSLGLPILSTVEMTALIGRLLKGQMGVDRRVRVISILSSRMDHGSCWVFRAWPGILPPEQRSSAEPCGVLRATYLLHPKRLQKKKGEGNKGKKKIRPLRGSRFVLPHLPPPAKCDCTSEKGQHRSCSPPVVKH